MDDRRYWTARWKKRRAHQLSVEPLCAYCARLGKVQPATTADHVVPHRGDDTAFWLGDLQSLCTSCHSSTKQLEERGRGPQGCDVNGDPIDPAHHWRAPGGGHGG
jgi:5-methylcytosine-specific restriction endonuclease McrA